MIMVAQDPSTGGWDKVQAVKVKRPKMSCHRGRTWDHEYITIDGQKIKALLDTTWGTRFYFEWKGQWYAAPLDAFDYEAVTNWIIA